MIFTIYTDGGARGNPGPSGAGAIVKDAQGHIVATIAAFLGIRTNNFAEYEAAILACEAIIKKFTGKKLSLADVTINMDSELVVKQMNGLYRVKHPVLRKQHERLSALVSKFGTVSFIHIPREQNTIADRLSNKAMDKGS